jgi:FkbM family methyltransferase
MKSLSLLERIKLRSQDMLQKLLSKFGIIVLRKRSFDELVSTSANGRYFRILQEFANLESLNQFWELERKSKSQIGQDLLAALTSDFKTGGYFVEFGATDGKTLSNTFLLEKELGWSGILAEPAQMWHTSLKAERSSRICEKAVWAKSGQTLLFHEDAELSTLNGFEALKHEVRSGKTYQVETISLNDLLSHYSAPLYIDFLSVDTEGSEYEILSNFDWTVRSFGLICVEHNYTENRGLIYSLLTRHGYRRILEDVSGWDDWYVGTGPKIRS